MAFLEVAAAPSVGQGLSICRLVSALYRAKSGQDQVDAHAQTHRQAAGRPADGAAALPLFAPLGRYGLAPLRLPTERRTRESCLCSLSTSLLMWAALAFGLETRALAGHMGDTNVKGHNMGAANEAALEFLLTRRSRPAKTLQAPYPDKDALLPILTAGLRTPDHGKLEPWRLLVLAKPALTSIACIAEARGAALGLDDEKIEKGRAQFRDSGCAVVVIESPVESEKIPAIEQTYSAGAVCLAVLNAALASGWGANWLSGWPSHDPDFCREAFGTAPNERVAGIIHIGTERAAPPDRPRPDLAHVVSWVED